MKRKEPHPRNSDYWNVIRNVGFPIYPEGNAESQSYEIWIESPEERHYRPGRRTGRGWYFDDTKLLLTDEVEDRQWLVSIDLSDGLHSMKIAKRQIGGKDSGFLLIEKDGQIRNGYVEVLLREEQARKYGKDKLLLRVP